MSTKNFKIKAVDFKDLVPLSIGICIASDKITVEGMDVGYMFRVKDENFKTGGWHFFSGTETEEFANSAKNFDIYHINTIANYDPTIIPYLHLPCGTELMRIYGTDKYEILSEDYEMLD